jgi:hemoglobin/transferrin/lactoferrin receptor protein
MPKGFTVFDLTAYWNVTDSVTLRGGVFNITGQTYAWWSDARGIADTSTVKDAYTQPDRNYSRLDGGEVLRPGSVFQPGLSLRPA